MKKEKRNEFVSNTQNDELNTEHEHEYEKEYG